MTFANPQPATRFSRGLRAGSAIALCVSLFMFASAGFAQTKAADDRTIRPFRVEVVGPIAKRLPTLHKASRCKSCKRSFATGVPITTGESWRRN